MIDYDKIDDDPIVAEVRKAREEYAARDVPTDFHRRTAQQKLVGGHVGFNLGHFVGGDGGGAGTSLLLPCGANGIMSVVPSTSAQTDQRVVRRNQTPTFLTAEQ